MSNGYLWVKAFHVTTAGLWLGSAGTMAVLTSVFKRDAQALAVLGRGSMNVSKYLMMPAAILTLLSGITLMIMVGGRPPIWMVWGLVAGPVTSVIGAVFARKTIMELAQLMNSGVRDEGRVLALQNRIGVLMTLIMALLVSVVGMMVLKPF